jgi:hypothetical protein
MAEPNTFQVYSWPKLQYDTESNKLNDSPPADVTPVHGFPSQFLSTNTTAGLATPKFLKFLI